MSEAFAALVRHALQGTARQPAEPPLPEQLHKLFAGQSEAPAEARLLLAAGAAAVYATAGRLPQNAPTVPDAAPEDNQPPCPPAVARLIGDFLAGRHADLLPEALMLLKRAGFRLPHALLPTALSYRGTAWRPALAAVLGERGRWLAGFNPAWQWVLDAQPAAPDDAALAVAWQEGTAERRLNAIRRLRQLDPAQARAWITATWRQENADLRADLLRALEIALSSDDEPFLETALDDRGPSVRDQAARLLTRLLASAFARRMAERAEACLLIERGKPSPSPIVSSQSTVQPPPKLRFKVTPPEAAPSAWRRDGLDDKPPTGQGKQGWLLLQVLSTVSPARWELASGAEPTALIEALRGNTWEGIILTAWSRAAVRHRRIAWAAPLWDRWREPDIAPPGGEKLDLLLPLVRLLPLEEAERRLLALLQEASDEDARDAATLLAHLPEPWSASFGHAYVLEMRHRAEALPTKPAPGAAGTLLATLDTAAPRLPPDCFAAALQPWDVPEGEGAHRSFWRQQIKRFTVTVDLRRQLWEGLRCSP